MQISFSLSLSLGALANYYPFFRNKLSFMITACNAFFLISFLPELRADISSPPRPVLQKARAERELHALHARRAK